MISKRLLAVFAALMVLVQLAACSQSLPADSSSTFIKIESKEETHTESSSLYSSDETVQDESHIETNNSSSPSGSGQNANNSQQTASEEESSSDITSDSGNTDVTSSQQGGSVTITPTTCNHSGDPYKNLSKEEFYADYKPACCNLDASYRSKHGFLSGSLEVPGQYAQESSSRPMAGKKYIRNTSAIYLDDGNTYVVMDAYGKEAMRIHKAGGYITLEEVAAYMYAFGGSGQIPANYTSKKSGKPNSSIWGEYLRLNHSYFIGDTDRYPYEPVLPDISGCGGRLSYYEMDIGTTGTVTPGYPAKPYVQSNKINRGAARIVYARQDLNGNGVYENNEVYVFYTHNHYNDFREYLNYHGGWGEMFGNVTGGGVYNSETNAKPTPYVQTAYKNLGA